MRRNSIDKWTLVQHSGYGYAGKPQFAQGVEERHIEDAKTLRDVERAGGLIIDNYAAASDRAEAENYPPGISDAQLTPNAQGQFSETTVDELRVYVPPLEAR